MPISFSKKFQDFIGVPSASEEKTPTVTAVEEGNIDLKNRPIVKNPDGSISTVRSMSVGIDGKEVVIPTVSDDGKILTEDEAIKQYQTTGKHLGKFNTIEEANTFAEQLHNEQDKYYSPRVNDTSTKPTTGDSNKKDSGAGFTPPAIKKSSDLEHPNVKKFLNFTGKAEQSDYDIIVGGKRFTDYSKHPNVVGATTKEGESTAAGKYQITNTTYKDVAPKLGIIDFKPESQDAIALELIKRNNALEDIKSGNFEKAINKLGNVWASFPSSPYSQSKKSWEWTRQELGMNVVPTSLTSYKKGNVTINIPTSFK